MTVTFNIDLMVFAIAVFAVATLSYAAVAAIFAAVRSLVPPSAKVGGLSRSLRADDRHRQGRVGSKPERTVAVLTTSHQIERLTAFVGEQSIRVTDAEKLHRDAGQQLDLASYSIQSLVRELGGIVPSLTPVKTAPVQPDRIAPSPVALAA